MVKFFEYFFLGVFSILLVACEQVDFSSFKALTAVKIGVASSDEAPKELRPILDIGAMIEASRKEVNVDLGFAKAIAKALSQDPAVLVSKNEVAASKASLRFTETGGDTQINATVLGGIEDITDETAGVAAILTANRMLYDGGLLNAKIEADRFVVKAAEQSYLAVRNERARVLAHSWIELELYQGLKKLIDSRLGVLDPLLVQLESVATAGVGDVTQVASAQRIVSSILVAEKEILQNYEQAKITFLNGFGQLPSEARYDVSWVSEAQPTSTVRELVERSPALLAKYWTYRAAEASILAFEAQDDFSIGFQAKFQRPFGGSGANSDESIGLSLTKDLYQKDQVKSQVNRAESVAQLKAAQVFAGYRDGENAILTSRQMIKSMNTAVSLARNNANNLQEEIDYLRKQLVIGGSTLESVLSAEAGLYEAESKEIGFIAQRQKAVITIMALTGHLNASLEP